MGWARRLSGLDLAAGFYCKMDKIGPTSTRAVTNRSFRIWNIELTHEYGLLTPSKISINAKLQSIMVAIRHKKVKHVSTNITVAASACAYK
ncbi:unnamed protein product [Dovyalis caffra]|uniref:Uncharacterized protein n=1 Tax=Dovyalis caffra TaxID=77055 RepID=A0AAV1R2T5_9ROSI|nr:unnamed protein product [Dovyalis caffra]